MLFKQREYLKYLLPALTVLALINIFPTFFLYIISLTNYDISQRVEDLSFVGLENYRYLFSIDKDFWKSICITLTYTFVSVTVELILGSAIALLFDANARFRKLKLSLFIIPMIATPSIIALMWKLILNAEYGVMNTFLRWMGCAGRNWLSTDFALVSLILIDIWQWTPYVTLMIYSGLQTVPQEPLEAADVDGASWFQKLVWIVLPHISTIVSITLLLKLIENLKSFDIVYNLTQGGPGNATELLSLHVFRLGFKQTHWLGRASACAVILLLIIIPIVSNLAKKISYSRESA